MTNILDQPPSVLQQQQNSYENTVIEQDENYLIVLPSILPAPKIDNEILTTIHQALQARKTLTITYRKNWQDTPNEYTLYPVGLVLVENMLYLAGFYKGDENEDSVHREWLDHMQQHQNFAVNRIVSAEIIDTAIPDWMEKFTLTFLQKLGTLELHMTHPLEVITLKLKLNINVGDILRECPIADNQMIEPYDDAYLLVTATLTNTQRLEDWLISMSQFSEVLEPLDMRERIIERLEDGLKQYRK